jgi:MYXO-CTERM domain-containing protein
MSHPNFSPSRSVSTSSRKGYGQQAGALSMLAPLALAGATLGLAANPAQAITLFTGPYAPANWTQSAQGNGSIDTSIAPGSIILNGPNDGLGNAQSVDFTIAAPAAGTVLFDWVYSTNDQPDADPFGSLLNGSFIQLSSDIGVSYQSGTASFSVLTGDVFGFRQRTIDSRFGSASSTISNFNGPTSAPPSSVPGPLPLIGAGAAWGWSRRLRQRIATPVTTAPQA